MRYAALLSPSAEWLPLLDRGVVTLNESANRLIWTDTGRFAAALTPTPGLAQKLAALPLDVEQARNQILASTDLSALQGPLEHLHLLSSIGAIASVASAGISLIGFAATLHRLNRIERQLDELITEVEEIRDAIRSIGIEQSTLRRARLAAAHSDLERALAASTNKARHELAQDARRLFQEARLCCLELWKQVGPWQTPSFELGPALELQGRYTAAAIGELQAQFILEDAGAFQHACRSASNDVAQYMAIDVIEAFRCRADSGCISFASSENQRSEHALYISQGLDVLAEEVQAAASTTNVTAQRLLAFENDALLAEQLALPSHELLIALSESKSVDIVALGNLRGAPN